MGRPGYILAGVFIGLVAGAAELVGEAPPATIEVEITPMDNMIAEIQADARRTGAYTGIFRISAAVIDALRATPREDFVLERSQSLAYANHPLPIGHGQTISQPFIVAFMTEALELEAHHRVLEVGTGSGYQAAVLSRLVAEVHTIEIIPELAAQARQRLIRLGYDNVHVYTGDGAAGWPEEALYDGIIVTAGSDKIPPALIEQLADDGRLIMPLGDPAGFQELVVYTPRTRAVRRLFPVRFVPLTGGA